MPISYKILFLSSYEWSDLWRRRQRLAHELSMRPEVASVLYVNPPVTTSLLDLVRGRFEPSHLDATPRAHLPAILGRPRRVADRVWVYTGSQKTLPLTRIQAIRELAILDRFNAAMYSSRMRACLDRLPGDQLIVYFSHPLHTFALSAFKSRVLSCYDWTDDWTQFELIPMVDRDQYARLCERIPTQADIVFAVSRSLYERGRQLNPNTYWIPNATGLYEMNSHGHAPDTEIEKITRPRLGYVGQIGDRIDLALLRKIAETRPDWSLVMIGPVWSNRAAEVDALGHLPNIHFVGPRPYASLPAILNQLDVCLVPHTCDALTASMDPIKLYDYLATGKPIVTTPVAGVDRFNDVLYVARKGDEFVDNIEQALNENGTRVQRRLDYARQNSWPQRAEQMWMAMRATLERREAHRVQRGNR